LTLSFVEQYSEHYLAHGKNIRKNRSVHDYGRCETCRLIVVDYDAVDDEDTTYRVYVRVENHRVVEFIDAVNFDVRFNF
jgi:hypothetical protein